ncbi:MAG: hypothetical protein MGF17_17265 [Trichodesmium sp. MAG_R04]|nr:hypothetical protein [Trichodesmium sp. MAG_R04]
MTFNKTNKKKYESLLGISNQIFSKASIDALPNLPSPSTKISKISSRPVQRKVVGLRNPVSARRVSSFVPLFLLF